MNSHAYNQETIFDVNEARKDFPALSQSVYNKPVIFLDSAASAQKPSLVTDTMMAVHNEHYANVHRGVYNFSQRTTEAFEEARRKVASFINAKTDNEIIFTRNATEAINLVAQCWGESVQEGDEIIISALEHHANIVPWYFLKEKYGAVLKVVPLLDDGSLDMQAYRALLSDKTKMVAITHMSNAIGTVVDAKEIIRLAKTVNAKTLIDGSQAIVHQHVDVQVLGCDFYVFTGHKLYGPSGIGVLYGQFDALCELPPYQGGGEMIEQVSYDRITYKEPPHRFEAGTPAIVEAIGLGAAIDYLNGLDAAAVEKHEADLLHYAQEQVKEIDGLTIFGQSDQKASILSFSMDGIHPHDIGTILDQMGVAVRAGHHCAQPLMKELGVMATVRASIALYNTREDIDQFVIALRKVKDIFG